MVSFPKISPNLLLGVGGIIAAVFLVNQIRKAGGDVAAFGAEFKPFEGFEFPKLPDIKFPDVTFPDISFPDIKFPDVTFPEFPDITKGCDEFTKSITDFFKQQQEDLSKLAGQTVTVDGTTITIPPETIIDPVTGIVTSPIPPTMVLSEAERLEAERQLEINRQRAIAEQALAEIPPEEDISGAEITAAINEAEFIRRQQEQILAETQPIPEIISELPIEQPFVGGGVSFIGGTIRENPIDTLAEAIDLGLTASQAADFLAVTGGKVTPSQIELGLVDPDIQNIVAGFVGGGLGQAVPVSADPLDILSIKESEAQEAAEFTCREFGLNCELVDSMMA